MEERHRREPEELKPGYVYNDEFQYFLYLGFEDETSPYPLIFINFTESTLTALSDSYSRIFIKEENTLNEFLEKHPEFKGVIMDHEVRLDINHKRQSIIDTVLRPLQRNFKLDNIL
mgnify:CR=1 FL=1|jgi:hypothetical protein